MLKCSVSHSLTLPVTVVSVADGATGGTLFSTRRLIRPSTPTVLFTGRPWTAPLIVTLSIGGTKVVFPDVQDGVWALNKAYEATLQGNALLIRQVKPTASASLEHGTAIACIVLASVVILVGAVLLGASVYRDAMQTLRSS